MNKEKIRGVLNNKELKEKLSQILPNFDITRVVRFLPYLDYIIKNQGYIDYTKLSEEEIDMLCALGEKGKILRDEKRIEFVNKQFYDLMQEVLYECYVCVK